jgi:diadenosine tetraphosphatase ApaH/serine/threonine PP2A family protein phosphatase
MRCAPCTRRGGRSACSATPTCRSAITCRAFGLATPDDRRPFSIPLEDATRYLVNPGSVGQPRDGDPRAGFGIVDTAAKAMTIYRVEYPIVKAQGRILEEGLPDVLAQRLALGR